MFSEKGKSEEQIISSSDRDDIRWLGFVDRERGELLEQNVKVTFCVFTSYSSADCERTAVTAVHSFIIMHLDFCSDVLAGLLRVRICQLQSVLS